MQFVCLTSCHTQTHVLTLIYVACNALITHTQDFDWGGAHVPLIPGQKAHRGVLPLEEAVWAEVDIPTFTTVSASASHLCSFIAVFQAFAHSYSIPHHPLI